MRKHRESTPPISSGVTARLLMFDHDIRGRRDDRPPTTLVHKGLLHVGRALGHAEVVLDKGGPQMTADDAQSTSAKVQPEQRVGAAMRNARESAGISLRDMAKRLGYHSHTTLSSHERGSVLPTDESVTGYERELGLKPGTLLRVLEGARIERHGDAWAKRRSKDHPCGKR